MSDPAPPAPAPPTTGGRKFPCPRCGARLDFDPRGSGLACPYCGHAEAIETDAAAEVAERDYLDALGRADARAQAIAGHATETKCPGCGAVVILDDTVAADACPFCTTHLETAPVAVSGLLPPESLVAFAVDLRAARAAFAAWVAALWFAPSQLKTGLGLGRLVGVYLPYWTYDTRTDTAYDGERGDDYEETQHFTQSLADGRTERRSRTVTRTRWTGVSGRVSCPFDDILVPATASLSAERLAEVGDFELAKLRPFDAAYLSGFQAERYSVGLKEGFQRAKGVVQPAILPSPSDSPDRSRITPHSRWWSPADMASPRPPPGWRGRMAFALSISPTWRSMPSRSRRSGAGSSGRSCSRPMASPPSRRTTRT